MNGKQVIKSFEEGKIGYSGHYFTDGHDLWFFGIKHVKREKDGIYYNMRGNNTTFTKKALNWITNVSIHSRAGVIKNNGIPIEDDKWYRVEE